MFNKGQIYLIIALLSGTTGLTQSVVKNNIVDGRLEIVMKEIPVLTYQFGVYESPSPINKVFNRSGFFHPISTLEGHVLTDIQPSDHYHHFGIWNPWTHVLFEGDTIDFWNLAKKQGTVRFKEFLEQDDDGFLAHHQHIRIKGSLEQVVLDEFQRVKVVPIDDKTYAIDYTIQYECATDKPFHILEYRYGGFTFRGTPLWNSSTSSIISSNKDRRDEIDGSLGKWCLVQGQLQNDFGAVLILSHKENYNHPEPLRVWPSASAEGAVFINFSPTKNKDWLLVPNQNYRLKYRVIVSSEPIDRKQADGFWAVFD